MTTATKKTTSKGTTTSTVKTSSGGVVMAGSTNVSAYFERSGIRYGHKLTHNPFIVFNCKGDRTVIEIVDSVQDLVKYNTSTKVMAQWQGKERSDFFQFTVGQLKRHIRENPCRVGQKI